MEIKNGKLLLYTVDRDYLNFLSEIDENVRHKDERKYYGIIITDNRIDYCIPFTCKIKKRSSKLTVNITNNGIVIAQLTLNNMIPVHTSLIKLVDVKNDKDKDYLNNELRYLRKKEVISSILKKAQNIFDVLSDEKNIDYEFFKKLCGNFKILEQKCNEWINRII